jgi:hypothetical protein
VRRMWPEEFAFLLNDAEEVDLQIPPQSSDADTNGRTTTRKALKVRLKQQDFEKILPLAEARYRLSGEHTGRAITLIATNPHYRQWHPADGGKIEDTSDSGQKFSIDYVIVFFLLDDVREQVEA